MGWLNDITEKGMITISRLGKAFVVFTVAKHHDEHCFDSNPPPIDLYVIPVQADNIESNDVTKRNENEQSGFSRSRRLPQAQSANKDAPNSGTVESMDKKISSVAIDESPISDKYFLGTICSNMDKESRSFIIDVESVHGIFKRFLKRKPKREALPILIIAEPHGDWKQIYKRTTYKRTLSSGGPIPLSVSLELKQDVQQTPPVEDS